MRRSRSRYDLQGGSQRLAICLLEAEVEADGRDQPFLLRETGWYAMREEMRDDTCTLQGLVCVGLEKSGATRSRTVCLLLIPPPGCRRFGRVEVPHVISAASDRSLWKLVYAAETSFSVDNPLITMRSTLTRLASTSATLPLSVKQASTQLVPPIPYVIRLLRPHLVPLRSGRVSVAHCSMQPLPPNSPRTSTTRS